MHSDSAARSVVVFGGNVTYEKTLKIKLSLRKPRRYIGGVAV
jgi:hypothetical protein